VRRLALLPLLCVPLLAACGEEPDDPPPIFEVKAPRGSQTADFPRVGMSFEHPRNWRLRRRDAPGVFELVSGEAIVAGWAYPREEPLPDTDADLEAAARRLEDAIKERDPDYRLINAFTTEQVAGALAIDLSGNQTLSGRELRTRSVHVFKGEIEYVIESLAPSPEHALVERRVLEPLLDSLELEGEVTEAAR
jgi:hypothetical protein